MNIFEHHKAFNTSHVASVTPILPSGVNFDSNTILERENPLIRDVLSDTSEDERELFDGDDLDIDTCLLL